ncbi:MAG: calcium-binding protein, partial [Roseococcus sp.]
DLAAGEATRAGASAVVRFFEAAIGGAGGDTLLGTSASNLLRGEAGNDRLDGRAGADRMIGGSGDDTYYVDNAGDLTTEEAGGGTDGVLASLSWPLDAELERLTLTGTADLNGMGNALANRVDGNAGANILDGDAGNDTLYGLAGDDTLRGGAGADTLDGGLGTDRLEGGLDADRFMFRSAAEANGDVIADFTAAEGDRIDLRGIDAREMLAGNQTFVWIGNAGFGGVAGQLRFAGGILEGDVDGDGTADFEIGLIGVVSLTAANIWL